MSSRVGINGAALQGRRLSANNNNKNKDPFAPLILMSGYVVKRSRRGFGTKWQKRYWQLLGDGALIYFNGDHRLKVLGEIDIAHTCYEVRHGAENCEIKFPSAVKPSCCFSVAVLKRTYYLFTFTTWEAEKWVEALTSTSYIINRLRPRDLDNSPAVQVALKALNETNSFSPGQEPPAPPTTQPPPYHHKAPAPPPPQPIDNSDDNHTTGSDEDSNSEGYDGHSKLPAPPKHKSIHMSVPDLRFDSPNNTASPHNGSWIDGSPRIRSSMQSAVAYTGGTPSPLTSTLTSIDQNAAHPGERRRRKKVSYSPQFSDIDSSMGSNTAVSSGGRRIDRGRLVTSRQKYMSQGNLFQQGNFLEDIEETDGNTSTLPSPAKLARMKQKWKSAYDVQQWSPAFEKLEELQKQEDMIRKRINEMKKFEPFSYLDIEPPKSTQNIEMPFSFSQSYPEEPEQAPDVPVSPFSQPIPSSRPPQIYSLRDSQAENQISEQPKSQASQICTPKKAPKISPKPAVSMRPRSMSVSAIPLPSTSRKLNTNKPQSDHAAAFSKPPLPPPPPFPGSSQQSVPPSDPLSNKPPVQYNVMSSKCISEINLKEKSFVEDPKLSTEMNVWIKKELDKLICEIKKIGYYSSNGQMEVKFGELLESTEGMFEALLGTLLTARKYKIIHFDGEILLKGINDDTPIVLLKTEI